MTFILVAEFHINGCSIYCFMIYADVIMIGAKESKILNWMVRVSAMKGNKGK